MKLQNHDIGVCSWSLRPKGMADLVTTVRDLGLSHVQLGLPTLLALPEADRERELELIQTSGLTLTGTMIAFAGEEYASIGSIRRTGGFVPDETWADRRRVTLEAAKLSQRLGSTKLSVHIGFIPAPNDGAYETMVDRVCQVAGDLAEHGVELLLETGQESPSELLQFLNNLSCKNVGVNFDPANLILYGSGEPVEAIQMLGKHVRHVHVKDAIRSAHPGLEWGEEVPFGDGEVPHGQFVAALQRAGYDGPLVIEREAGDDRAADVRYAIETLKEL